MGIVARDEVVGNPEVLFAEFDPDNAVAGLLNIIADLSAVYKEFKYNRAFIRSQKAKIEGLDLEMADKVQHNVKQDSACDTTLQVLS